MFYLKNKIILRRIFVTFLLCLCFYCVNRIPLPLSTTVKGNIEISNLLQVLAGSSSLGLFMLGVAPYTVVVVVLQLLRIFNNLPVNKWYEGGMLGQIKLQRLTYFLTFMVASVESTVLIKPLQVFKNIGVTNEINHWIEIFVILSVSGGSVFVAFLIKQIDDKGIGSGVIWLIFTNLIGNVSSIVFNFYVFQWAADHLLYSFLILLSVLLFSLLIVYLFGLERRVYVYTSKFAVGYRLHYFPIKYFSGNVLPIVMMNALFSFFSNFDTYGFFDINEYQGLVAYSVILYIVTYWYNYAQFNINNVVTQLRRDQFYVEGVCSDDLATFIDKEVFAVFNISSCLLVGVVVLPLLVCRLIGLSSDTCFLVITNLILGLSIFSTDFIYMIFNRPLDIKKFLNSLIRY